MRFLVAAALIAFTSPVRNEDAAPSSLETSRYIHTLFTPNVLRTTSTSPLETDRGGKQKVRSLNIWIKPEQVQQIVGLAIRIQIASNGGLLPHIKDPLLEKTLPMLPSHMDSINFTWSSGQKKFSYSFPELTSEDPTVMHTPTISIPLTGQVPRKNTDFSVSLACTGNVTGVVGFRVELDVIHKRNGRRADGFPLKLRLKKNCRADHDPEDGGCTDPCDDDASCGGPEGCRCDQNGSTGRPCITALCYPPCQHGGECVGPGRCSCPPGYNGPHCEGGICEERCLNGGKCIQKDTCRCKKGYYGKQCQYSKCLIPCQNGGRCSGVNSCRCRGGFSGHHCEQKVRHRCQRCRHGVCMGARCLCNRKWRGRRCDKRKRRRRAKHAASRLPETT